MSWPQGALGPLCSKIGSGVTPRGGDAVYLTEGVSLIRSQNVYNSRFEFDGLAHITDEQADVMSGVEVTAEDVLLNITGDSVARCCRAPVETLPARVNQHVAIIRPDPAVLDADFLCYFLTSPFMQSSMLSLAGSGGTRKALTKGMIEKFEVPLPALNLQKILGARLRAYDDLIANNWRRIELLEQSARLLFKEWFVNMRYPGHEHDKVAQGLPKGWQQKLLGDVAATNSESFSARSLPPEINYIDISSVQSGRILRKTRMSAEDAPGRARRRVEDGDVIWSNVRPNLRQFALIVEPNDADVVSTGFTTLTPETVPSSFLYMAVTTDPFIAYLVNHTTGASYPAVRPDDFERAELLVPTPALLDDFNSQCEPMFRLAHCLEAQNLKLAAARDLLLPRLMDGRLSV